ncbi:DUF2818 family protein [Niveibacterium terrae]|uniref:DUF2818 family protein n=1 Tax=Niveibacterium terrae TaxID=3373598 RepID=UPI003A8D57A9
MSAHWGGWALILAAGLVANGPFLSPRLMWVGPRVGAKTLRLSVLEWAVGYALIALVAIALEYQRYGAVHRQGWRFYAATVILLMIFAFPGFAWRCVGRGDKESPDERSALS